MFEQGQIYEVDKVNHVVTGIFGNILHTFNGSHTSSFDLTVNKEVFDWKLAEYPLDWALDFIKTKGPFLFVSLSSVTYSLWKRVGVLFDGNKAEAANILVEIIFNDFVKNYGQIALNIGREPIQDFVKNKSDCFICRGLIVSDYFSNTAVSGKCVLCGQPYANITRDD